MPVLQSQAKSQGEHSWVFLEHLQCSAPKQPVLVGHLTGHPSWKSFAKFFFHTFPWGRGVIIDGCHFLFLLW